MADKKVITPNDDDDEMYVTLDLEDGSTMECAVITIFTVGEHDYIALLPVDEKGEPFEDADAIHYRYTEDENGDPTLEYIDDDEEYEAVEDKFDEWLDEQLFEEYND